jgi:GcrA cell cycle regulator
MAGQIVWLPSAKERVRELWATGMSASQIGDVLGCSKNAIIGVVHRMRLPPRETPPELVGVVRAPRPKRGQAARPKRGAEVAPPPAPARAPVRYAACLWPTASPKSKRLPVRFECQEPRAPTRPYCATHCAIAYERLPKARFA